jgi:outer membrane receptor protein involved in Fe transport
VSFEAGYRGEMKQRLQLTVDGYYSIVDNFVSALLPYANPTYGAWTAPSAVDPTVRPLLEDAVATAVGPASGLSRLSDPAGTTAFVFSYGNAGRATEWGLEVGADLEVTPSFHLKAGYGFFDYRVDEGVPTVPGDLIVPNTPAHRGNLQLRYSGAKFDAWSGINFKSSHDWVSGFFQGMVPSSQRMDMGLGYVLGSRVRVHATATNLLGQSVYHIYGGSIDRRRILFGVTGYL